MTRRDIGLLVTLALLSLPFAAVAQPPGSMHRIGVLRLAAPPASSIEAFRQGLHDLGYLAGQNLVIEYRYAEDHLERLPHLVADLIQLKVDIIVALGGPAARAAKQATSTIPIVMVVGDAIEQGLVTSLSRPGGNITGFSNMNPELSAKRLELLKTAVPEISRVAVLWCPDLPANPPQWRATHLAAQALGVHLHSLEVRSSAELETVVSALTSDGADAVIVFDCALFSSQVERMTKLPLPVMYASSTFVRAGGLMSYGADTRGLSRRVAVYVDKILRGAKPGDLPVEQPSTLELIINLTTAQSLGLTIPPALLFQADEVLR